MNAPNEVAANYVGIGKKKTLTPISKLLVLGIFAGMFIAMAAVGANTASCMIPNAGVAKLVGAMIFPVGLAMVLIAGSELFTGNTLIIIPVLEKQATVGGMLKNWVAVYIGNFIGSLFVAFLVNSCNQLGLFSNALAATTIKTALAKSSLNFGNAFILGILCNFLVCIAVWISFAAKDVAGKFLGLYMPIMLFVLAGFEHSVANMYYVPAGLIAAKNPAYLATAIEKGIDVTNLTWGNFFMNNLIPVTLGNIVGGSLIVGLGYWFAFLKDAKK